MIPDTRPSLPSLNQEALNWGVQVWWRSSHLPIRGRFLDVDVTHLGQCSGLCSLVWSRADGGVRLPVDNSLTWVLGGNFTRPESGQAAVLNTKLVPKLAPHGRRHVAPGLEHR